MRPIQYNIYKGMGGKFGAVQFNLQEPHFYEPSSKKRDFTGNVALDEVGKLREGWKINAGAVFLEITSTKDKNVYDWSEKVIMSLSVNDIGKVLLALITGDDCKLMHDPGAQTPKAGAVNKSLHISSPSGTKVGVMISVTQISGGTIKTHKVPLDGAEVIVLVQLLRSAVSRALKW